MSMSASGNLQCTVIQQSEGRIGPFVRLCKCRLLPIAAVSVGDVRNTWEYAIGCDTQINITSADTVFVPTILKSDI